MNYIDIETASAYKDFESAPERVKDCWIAKMAGEIANKIREGAKDFEEKSYMPSLLTIYSALYKEKAGLYSEFNKIVCVSLGTVLRRDGVEYIYIKSSSGDDEKEILEQVAAALGNQYDLCAHNGKAFDFPQLSRKYMIYGLPMPSLFNNGGKKPWEIPLIDTQEMWKFGDMRYTVSLDQLSMVFGLPSPKENMHGSEVSEAYWNGRLSEIVKYCELDVRTLVNVHRKMTGLGAITEDVGEAPKQEELF